MQLNFSSDNMFYETIIMYMDFILTYLHLKMNKQNILFLEYWVKKTNVYKLLV